ncbi:cysteine proteinase [Trichodelitschia bisporula]|uniref:ubiquitinyl hydrolase 1 n=1 Tax=Trichodelitschia bisporula TaxID=703511 RepID=A0A6G1HNN0_9PEZI|nr:cysteine proteinase [Trichodelitschia bisporula]
MEAFAQQPDDELAQLQELSNKWESDASGPLVSERVSSSAITTEYANADPVYQAKTATLPQKYAQYRTCRGDGHCGWRAVAFSYFETLQRMGNPHKFLEEETRLKSLRNILNDAGFQEHLYEDFAEDMFDLLRETAAANDGGASLLQTFNDPHRSMSVITYLKLLTSAWIQKHPDQFQPFLHQPVKAYCQSHIEPAICEIEHVGMDALVNVLVKPAGIAVEILYLDRTPGTEVNTYRFDPVDHNNAALPNPPTFRLLYRPGHYDILYKLEDLPSIVPPPIAHPAEQRVFLNHHQSTQALPSKLPFDTNNFEIPGLSIFSGPAVSGPGVAWAPYPTYDFSASPISPQPIAQPITQAIPQPRIEATPAYAPIAAPPPPPVSIPTEYYSTTMPLEPPVTSLPLYQPSPIDRGGPFRPSIWEYESYSMPQAPHPPLCQTAIFRNSHYNTAHFNNPDFEPEQWQPDTEYNPSDRSRKKSSHSQ